MPPKTRILFVDDEPRVLDGLRRSMRARRHVWECSFSETGADAQRVLAERAFDVVVSDMRMPGMDGAELLRSVAELHPQTIRIVLSGQMDDSAAMRASRVAHRFLTKPCDGDLLDSTIDRALGLRALLASERLRQAVGGIGSLPVLSSSAIAINRIVSDENGTPDEIAAVIEQDVGMAAKVLQLVNSAFFGVPRTIASVRHAVSYLGMNTIRNLVIAQSLFSELSSGGEAAQRSQQDHSLLASRLAPLLLKDPSLGPIAATAAMLHDIGSLVLSSRLPAECAAVIARARSSALPVHEVERETFGASHAEIGAYLLGLWGLPHDVIDAVANHHNPPHDGDRLDVNVAVRIAIALSNDRVARQPDDKADEHASDAQLERLGLAEIVSRIRVDLDPTASGAVRAS